MKTTKLSRRNFLGALSAAGLVMVVDLPTLARGTINNVKKPVILGGLKTFTGNWPGWPVMGKIEETELLSVLKSGGWCRLGNNTARRFENELQKLLGAKHVLAVSSGTSALYAMLGALDIGPGDEVIIPPYTFIATYNVIPLHYALPIFVEASLTN